MNYDIADYSSFIDWLNKLDYYIILYILYNFSKILQKADFITFFSVSLYLLGWETYIQVLSNNNDIDLVSGFAQHWSRNCK